MEEKKITGRGELNSADSGLYRILRVRGLLDEVGFEEKKKERPWKSMSDEEVVEIAMRRVKELEIRERHGLKKTDSGLYQVLRERGLLDRIFSPIEKQKTDSARDAVIDALEAFSSENQNSEEKIGVA